MLNWGQSSADMIIAGGTLASGITVVRGALLQILGLSLSFVQGASGIEVEVFGQGKCMDNGQGDREELDDK